MTIRHPVPLTIDELNQKIIDYFAERLNLGGYWQQEPYKSDFFLIFRTAYWNGYCGGRATQKYATARNQRRTAVPSGYVICGDSIASRLRELCKGRHRTSDNLE